MPPAWQVKMAHITYDAGGILILLLSFLYANFESFRPKI